MELLLKHSVVIRKICDYPDRVKCYNNQTLDNCDDGIYAVPGNCSQYKICKNGEINYFNCDSNLLFDYITSECINPSDAKCLSLSTDTLEKEPKSFYLYIF